jgi:hypothetical protein
MMVLRSLTCRRISIQMPRSPTSQTRSKTLLKFSDTFGKSEICRAPRVRDLYTNTLETCRAPAVRDLYTNTLETCRAPGSEDLYTNSLETCRAPGSEDLYTNTLET